MIAREDRSIFLQTIIGPSSIFMACAGPVLKEIVECYFLYILICGAIFSN